MNIKVNDIVKFDNYSYQVLDIITFENNYYAYLINNDEFINDTSIVRLEKVGKMIDFRHIDNDIEFKYVLYKIYLNHKRDILSFFD